MLNCVDLFAGAGGFSLAARQAGFRLRLAIENNMHAIATYRTNLCIGNNPPKLLEGDISGMSAEDIYADTFKEEEKCDLIIGGPPCQGFSTHRINGAGVKDKRNELIHVYFEFVKTFSPTAFLMENVPGILWPRHALYLRKFYAEATLAGYHVFEPVIIDARDFGVPQRRKRVFLLGVSEGHSLERFSWPPPATHGDDAARLLSSKLKPWKNCSMAFSEAPPDDPNNIHMHHNDQLTDAFRRTPPNGGSRAASGRTLECHKKHDGHSDVYGRINPALPSPTMTTACINPSKGRFVHPTCHHGITVRQAARMQTFPDGFIFEGGLMAAGLQVGNAVPVRLGQSIIEHIRPLILRARDAEPACGVSKERSAA